MVGGVLGVAAGLVGSRFRIVGIEPVVAPYSVFLAFGVAVAVGPVLRDLPGQPGGVTAPDRGTPA